MLPLCVSLDTKFGRLETFRCQINIKTIKHICLQHLNKKCLKLDSRPILYAYNFLGCGETLSKQSGKTKTLFKTKYFGEIILDINKEKDIGIIDIIRIIKKYKQFNVIIIIASLIFSILYSFTSIRLYKSYISIYPSSSESNISRSFNNLQGLATTFGIDIGGGINNEYY